jgi:hypothetical protein
VAAPEAAVLAVAVAVAVADDGNIVIVLIELIRTPRTYK